MKHPIDILLGADLDSAVHKALGRARDGVGMGIHYFNGYPRRSFMIQLANGSTQIFWPTVSWSDAGDVFRQCVCFAEPCFHAGNETMSWIGRAMLEPIKGGTVFSSHGPDQLTAAMRAFVYMRFGSEVELP